MWFLLLVITRSYLRHCVCLVKSAKLFASFQLGTSRHSSQRASFTTLQKIVLLSCCLVDHYTKYIMGWEDVTMGPMEPWVTDVAMGSFDGAEICELVGLYILHGLCAKYGKDSIGLYRDDGLAVFKNISGPTAERMKNDITRHFKNDGLNITIQTNTKTVNYLDMTFNLNSGTYYPYRKPNDQPLYINTKSNHPPRIIKQLPDNISH